MDLLRDKARIYYQVSQNSANRKKDLYLESEVLTSQHSQPCICCTELSLNVLTLFVQAVPCATLLVMAEYICPTLHEQESGALFGIGK